MAEIAMGKMEDQNHGLTPEKDKPRQTNHPPQLSQPVQPSTLNSPPPSYQPPPSTQLPLVSQGNVTSFVLETDTNDCTGFQRERWTSTGEFIASVLASGISFGTYTVLPYSGSKDSVAFMAIYALFYFILGVPILYMDISLGQFTSRGPAHIWNLCPLFRGIGVGMMVYSAMYLPVMSLFSSWSVYYVAQSFSTVLPWSNCNNAWNTPTCFNRTGAGVQYLENRVLQLSEACGIDDMGGLQWELVGCCAGLSVLVFFALFWGVKVLGKVFCITMSLMLVLTLVLFVKAMTLPGSTDGLAHLFTLNLQVDLKRKHVWLSAFFRAMLHVGVSSGLVNNLASYRQFKSSALRDSVIICSISTVGLLLAGLMMMSLTGVLADTKQVSIITVKTIGVVSAFEKIPELFPHLDASHFWSFAYFFILLLVGLNYQFVCADMIITAIVDSLPRRSRMIRIVITMVTCIATLLLTLPYLTKGGVIFMTLVDSFGVTLSIYVLGILQFLTVGWIYGMGRLGRDIEMMTGIPPPIIIKFIWCFIIPPVLLTFLVLSLIDYSPPSFYSMGSRDFPYPTWSHALGWLIALAPLAPVPVFVLLALVTSSQYLLRPRPEWGPAEHSYKRQYDSQWKYHATLTDRIISIFRN
ncbi:sodium-dependent noradrenaline transporter-like [Haliotis asinina]|uniref:sodium-dependent noradrenaline transporter-like n=1 Tax=Haliotis asinina TaxID=109174 RepID=UPI003531E051